MKQLTARDLWDLMIKVEALDIPVTIVGEQQVAVSADIVYQFTLDGDEEPVALQIQLIPNASS